MTENLILPVPELLSAVYLVPATLDAAEAKEHTRAALAEHVPVPVRTAAGKMLQVGAVHVDTLPSTALPSLSAGLQEHLGVASDLVRTVTSASAFVVVGAEWPPGWPPVHESVARACAAALAANLAVPLVDTFVPQVLTAEQAITSLPGADSQLRLADWVLVLQSAGHLGLWMTTKGLGRFGLPELQVHGVPPQLGDPWTAILSGIAGRLLDLWLDALRQRGESAFAQPPAEFEVSEADVADARGSYARGDRHALVRLALDPAPDDRTDSFLTVRPPDRHRRSAGEYLADVAAALLGEPEQEIRYLPQTEAMRDAIEAAKNSLLSVRARFLAGDLPLKARLIVKHAVTTPSGTEYPWAYVNSWADPAKVLASSGADAVRDLHIRAGRPVVVDADAIIDWAVWIDGRGIVEGGRTNEVALSHESAEQP